MGLCRKDERCLKCSRRRSFRAYLSDGTFYDYLYCKRCLVKYLKDFIAEFGYNPPEFFEDKL